MKNLKIFFIFAFPLLLSFKPSLAGEAFTCCQEREISYQNGGISLAATLLTPRENGKYPAVVMVQGAGNSGRSNVWSQVIAETLVEMGLAVLWTDKRGSGKSGGDWRSADFYDLAQDALSGVRAIQNLPEVKGNKIGLLGLSQGGHVVPIAASLGEVDFVISFVSSNLPMQETLIHELEQTYRQHGLDDPTIEFLQSMTLASFKYIDTGEGFEEYLEIRSAIETEIGSFAVETWPDDEGDWYWAFWRGIYNVDPLPSWKKVIQEKNVPVFIAYGELDEHDNVPVAASVARFRENIVSNNLTLKVYAETGHSLFDQKKAENSEFQLVQPLFDELDAWLKKNVRRPD